MLGNFFRLLSSFFALSASVTAFSQERPMLNEEQVLARFNEALDGGALTSLEFQVGNEDFYQALVDIFHQGVIELTPEQIEMLLAWDKMDGGQATGK